MELIINDRFRNRKLSFFNSFKVVLKYDSIASTFSFSYYFNPDNPELKELSCIGHYHIATITDNGETLITGQITSITFSDDPNNNVVSIGGYSLPGILEDSDILPAANDIEFTPYQFNNLSLREITEKVVFPFGLKIKIDPLVAARMEEVFEECNAKPGESIKAYLSKLTAQKNILLSHTSKGELFFTSAQKKQQAIFYFNGSFPATSMSLIFNGQGMHSHIRIVEQADIDNVNETQSEVRNPYIINSVFRPKVIIKNSRSVVQDSDEAASNVLAQELKNLRLKITLGSWYLNQKIIRAGDWITVINPRVYLFKKSEWIIEEVDLQNDPEKKTAILTCVVPEVYNEQPPSYLFAGINQHA